MVSEGRGDAGWRWFDDPRFELRLRYPAEHPSGTPVEIAERTLEDGFAVHLRSADRELYVEIARMAPIAPEEEYRRHLPALTARFGEGAVSKLGSTLLAGEPARTYAWRWDGDERIAIVLATAAATYRVVYDPASSLIAAIVATCELRRG
jgi:hypothetical protein